MNIIYAFFNKIITLIFIFLFKSYLYFFTNFVNNKSLIYNIFWFLIFLVYFFQ